MEPEYVTLGQLEIEENVVGSSTLLYSASSSMMKKNEKKQVERKYSCDEPDCQKSYTQSHNLKSHKKKKHNFNLEIDRYIFYTTDSSYWQTPNSLFIYVQTGM